MNVIKHGKFYNHEFTCEKCGCVFSYNKEDLENHDVCVGKIHIPCPECDETCCIADSRYDILLIKRSFK